MKLKLHNKKARLKLYAIKKHHNKIQKTKR